MHRLECFILSQSSYILLSLFKICFSLCSSDWVISIILSSRSLMHSSAVFSWLFIAFSVVFISAIELSNIDWLLFTVSNSLLQ